MSNVNLRIGIARRLDKSALARTSHAHHSNEDLIEHFTAAGSTKNHDD